MMNPFNNLLSDEFKQIFNNAIDSILDPQSGLVQPCVVRYATSTSSSSLCNNCLYDNISRLSSNIYNNTGPKPFPDGGICPVCVGAGLLTGNMNTSSEVLYLAVIIDSKKFINVSDLVNLDGTIIQTISDAKILQKINNAIDIEVHGSLYQRINSPQFCGLSEHKYIVTLWRSK